MSDDDESSSERDSLRFENGGAADNLQQPAAPAPDSSAVAARLDTLIQSLGEALREARIPRGAALPDSGSLHKTASQTSSTQTNARPQRHMDVRVRIAVKRVMDIKLVQHSFTANIQLEASWVDPELASKDLDEHKPVEDLKEVDRGQRCGVLKLQGLEKESFFAPRLSIKNCVKVEEGSSRQWYKIYPPKDGEEDPVVCLRWELTAQFRTGFDLSRFPVDSQKLPFVLVTGWPTKGSNKHTAQYTVSLQQNLNGRYRSFCTVDPFSDVSSEYSLSKRVQFKEDMSRKEHSAEELRYSELTMQLHVRRKASFWVYHLIIPLFIITTALLLGYGIKQQDFSDRSQITLSVLLSQVGFKYVAASMLPKLSYLTYIDHYVLGCFVGTFAVGLEQSIASTGLFVEPMLTLNVTGNATVAASSVFPFGSVDRALSGGQLPRVPVQIPLVAWYLFIAWLALHVIVGILVWHVQRKDREVNAFFHGHKDFQRAVWVGPIDQRHALEDSKEDTRENIKAYFQKRVTTPGASVVQVVVYEQQDVSEKCKAAQDTEDEKRYKEEDKEARKRLQTENSRGQEEPTRKHHACAVVLFSDDRSAEVAHINHTQYRDKQLSTELKKLRNSGDKKLDWAEHNPLECSVCKSRLAGLGQLAKADKSDPVEPRPETEPEREPKAEPETETRAARDPETGWRCELVRAEPLAASYECLLPAEDDTSKSRP